MSRSVENMRHFTTTEDWSRGELEGLLELAAGLKKQPFQTLLHNRTIALLFFNPSLRTRSSFDIGIHQLGGHAVILEPGKGSWPIAFDPIESHGVMEGEPEEHVREVARVLSRYCDLIAVRAFPKFQSWQEDREDAVIRAFVKHATVPVINLETIVHPCQELALALTLKEKFGTLDRRRFLLTWTYHPRPLNTAVANSALLIAAKMGMDVTLLCPSQEYLLDPRYIEAARAYTDRQGRRFSITHDIDSAYRGAEVVYAKSWGALPYFGRWHEERELRERARHFIVDKPKMTLTPSAYFSHCLPLRRNVKATDEVIDSPRSLVIEEAENRLHVQKAVMVRLLEAPHE